MHYMKDPVSRSTGSSSQNFVSLKHVNTSVPCPPDVHLCGLSGLFPIVKFKTVYFLVRIIYTHNGHV